jgi:hypothetical protein
MGRVGFTRRARGFYAILEHLPFARSPLIKEPTVRTRLAIAILVVAAMASVTFGTLGAAARPDAQAAA